MHQHRTKTPLKCPQHDLKALQNPISNQIIGEIGGTDTLVTQCHN